MNNDTETSSLLSDSTTPATTEHAVPDPAPSAEGQVNASPAGSEQEVEPEAGAGEGVEKGAPEPAPALTVDDLSLPEGFVLPEDTANEFLSLVNEPPESRAELANKMLGLHTSLLQSAADEYAKQWETLQEEWRTEVRALPEIGGDNLDRSLGEIAKVLDKYGGKEVRDALSVTGAGNHPALVQMFHRIAKDLNEQPPVKGAPAAGQPRDRASRMFPTS